jgi:hypothetical protein
MVALSGLIREGFGTYDQPFRRLPGSRSCNRLPGILAGGLWTRDRSASSQLPALFCSEGREIVLLDRHVAARIG